MQIMYRMCAATSRWRIDAIETPYNVPKSRSWGSGKELGVASHASCRAFAQMLVIFLPQHRDGEDESEEGSRMSTV